MRIAIVVLAVLGAAVGIWITREVQANRLVWDHFDTVKPGILYRSGQLEKEQLAAAVKKYGIRTVVNFQLPGAGVDAESKTARELGIDFMNLPMPGDGSGLEEQFREVLAACADPARRPVIVHCARGTCRTGASVALYRFERDGWTVEDVAAEAKRQAYRDGWLPGFVYRMVKERPFDERYNPRVRHDRNLPSAGVALAE